MVVMKLILLFVLAVGCGDDDKDKPTPVVSKTTAAEKDKDAEDEKDAANKLELEKLKKDLLAMRKARDAAIRAKEAAENEDDDSASLCDDEVAASTVAIDKIQSHPDAKPALPDVLMDTPPAADISDIYNPAPTSDGSAYDWDSVVWEKFTCRVRYPRPEGRGKAAKERNNACTRYKNAHKAWKALLPTYYAEAKEANAALETCLEVTDLESE